MHVEQNIIIMKGKQAGSRSSHCSGVMEATSLSQHVPGVLLKVVATSAPVTATECQSTS